MPCSVVTLASKIVLCWQEKWAWPSGASGESHCLSVLFLTHTHKRTLVNNSIHMLRIMQGDKHKLIWIKANRNTLRQLNWNSIPCLSGRHRRWTPCWYQGRLHDLVSASRQLQMTVPGLLPGGNAKQAGRQKGEMVESGGAVQKEGLYILHLCQPLCSCVFIYICIYKMCVYFYL